MAMREQDETPKYEAESHSPEFLEKAAELSKKRGKKGRKVSAHRDEKKRRVGKKHTSRKRITKKL